MGKKSPQLRTSPQPHTLRNTLLLLLTGAGLGLGVERIVFSSGEKTSGNGGESSTHQISCRPQEEKLAHAEDERKKEAEKTRSLEAENGTLRKELKNPQSCEPMTTCPGLDFYRSEIDSTLREFRLNDTDKNRVAGVMEGGCKVKAIKGGIAYFAPRYSCDGIVSLESPQNEDLYDRSYFIGKTLSPESERAIQFLEERDYEKSIGEISIETLASEIDQLNTSDEIKDSLKELIKTLRDYKRNPDNQDFLCEMIKTPSMLEKIYGGSPSTGILGVFLENLEGLREKNLCSE